MTSLGAHYLGVLLQAHSFFSGLNLHCKLTCSSNTQLYLDAAHHGSEATCSHRQASCS